MIFGPPGSGKGTYASRLQSKLGIPAISIGDIFREITEIDSALAREIKRYMNAGELVPDKTTQTVLKERLSEDDTKRGFILDGYPRTLEQAKALTDFVKIDVTINLVVPKWIIIERLTSRRICKNCGEVYNVRFLKPRMEGVCDKCGGELHQRVDDTVEVIEERLRVYEKQTQPLLAYYTDRVPFVEFKCEDINTPPEVAVEEILKKLKNLEDR
ncbi:nucleoside monophosphate kinase [Candidatus Bathyarchaeota archaeon]|nr:nucleoside monophosphate kinase [Candidatus Bathyarchaeota archaeon]